MLLIFNYLSYLILLLCDAFWAIAVKSYLTSVFVWRRNVLYMVQMNTQSMSEFDIIRRCNLFFKSQGIYFPIYFSIISLVLLWDCLRSSFLGSYIILFSRQQYFLSTEHFSHKRHTCWRCFHTLYVPLIQ